MQNDIICHDLRKWCWAESDDAEVYYGPFDTMGEALMDAISDKGVYTPFFGRCNFANPSDSIEAIDGQWLLELLEHGADEDLRSTEGETFELLPGADVNELKRLMAGWISKNVKTAWFVASVGKEAI